MKTENQIQKEVEETLALLGNTRKVSSSPLLRSRILEAAKKKGPSISPIWRYSMAAALAGLLALNLFVVKGYYQDGDVSAESTISLEEDLLTEYGLSSSNQIY